MKIVSTHQIGLLAMLCSASMAYGQVENFRITEVDPDADQVEITNIGGLHTTPAAHPFCHRFNYATSIPSGTTFLAGEIKLFTVSSLHNTDSDLWLYKNSGFSSGANIAHGVKYGPAANVGRMFEASSAGKWPSTSAFSPAPPVGTTLAYDGFGFHPADWYIDETPTLGSADSTTPATVATDLAHPSGTQDFENVQLGDEVFAIVDWFMVNSSSTPGIYTVRVVNDVQGTIGGGPAGVGSTRWLRIRDQDAANVENRFYSNAIITPDDLNYKWTFFVNLEETPPGGKAVKPRLTIQHRDGGYANAWGVEFTSTGANLVVTGNGGAAASTQLYALSSPTGVGDWVKIDLAVDFCNNTVSAAANEGSPVSLPINLTGDKSDFRFCYRGEGTGNINTMLLDDVSIDVDLPCAADVSPTCGNGQVNVDDLLVLIGAWGNSGVPSDLDGSGQVNVDDLLLLIGAWGPCP